jgi:hypothetical protein
MVMAITDEGLGQLTVGKYGPSNFNKGAYDHDVDGYGQFAVADALRSGNALFDERHGFGSTTAAMRT